MIGTNPRDRWLDAFANNPELHETQRLITAKPMVLIRISTSYRRHITDSDLYEATRKWWRAGDRIQRAPFAVAVYEGVCLEVYEVHEWCRVPFDGGTRWVFDGSIADDDIRNELLFKSVKHLFPQGAANPIRYHNI